MTSFRDIDFRGSILFIQRVAFSGHLFFSSLLQIDLLLLFSYGFRERR
jgi:hypothetical protein